MEIPVELQNLILLGVGMVVTFLLTQLAKRGLDFSGYKSQLVAALFAAVMVIIKTLLSKVPGDLTGLVTVLLQLFLVVFGAFGVHGFYKSRQAK